MKALPRTLFSLVFLSLAVMAAAQPRSDVPRNGACFYRDTGYRGSYFCTQVGDSLQNLPSGFNDSIRSIRIYGNAQVQAFNDNQFRGADTIFRSDVPDLHMLVMATDRNRNWAERISSLHVTAAFDRDYQLQWGQGRNYGGVGACFFDQTNFRGRSFCIDRGQSLNNLPSGFNDRIQSIRVFGDSEVQIFNDNNFGGVAARTRRDVADLRVWRIPDDPTRNWGGRISSVRVDNPGRGRWDTNGGYRDRDDHRNLVRCTSRQGDRQQYCDTRGYVRDAQLINADGPCRKGSTWGVDNGRLWVSNGCSAEFDVQR